MIRVWTEPVNAASTERWMCMRQLTLLHRAHHSVWLIEANGSDSQTSSIPFSADPSLPFFWAAKHPDHSNGSPANFLTQVRQALF